MLVKIGYDASNWKARIGNTEETVQPMLVICDGGTTYLRITELSKGSTMDSKTVRIYLVGTFEVPNGHIFREKSEGPEKSFPFLRFKQIGE